MAVSSLPFLFFWFSAFKSTIKRGKSVTQIPDRPSKFAEVLLKPSIMFLKNLNRMKKIKAIILFVSSLMASVHTNAQDATKTKMNFEEGKKIKVGFLVYQGVEAQDLSGPLDVFVKANRMSGSFEIFLISATPDKNIKTESEIMQIKAQYSVEDAPQADILIVPGAAPDIVRSLSVTNPSLNRWMMAQNQKTKITASVCTGSLYLGDLGFLTGREATTHPACIPALKEIKGIKVKENVRFATDEKYMTGSGITSGIDVALQIIEMTQGKDRADLIAKIMVYNRNGNMEFMQK